MSDSKIISKFSLYIKRGKTYAKFASGDDSSEIIEIIGNSISENVSNILKYVYDDLYEFKDGICAVKRGNYWGAINALLYEVIEPLYDTVHIVNNSYAIVSKNGKYGVLPINCALQTAKLEYDHIYIDYGNNIDKSQTYFKVKIGGLFGYICINNMSIETISPCIYDNAYDFGYHNFAIVMYNGKYGMIDRQGKWIIEPMFDTYDDSPYVFQYKGYNATIEDKFYKLYTHNGTYEKAVDIE